jgi:predicted AAA+ superfamily ATPase
VIEEIVKIIRPDELFFWATHGGAELDLFFLKDGRRFGVECKREDAPRLTRSIHTALNDLQLDHLAVIYPGERPYPLAERVTVMPLKSLATNAEAIYGGVYAQ